VIRRRRVTGVTWRVQLRKAANLATQKRGPSTYLLVYYERRLVAEPLRIKPPEGMELHQSGPFYSESDALIEARRLYREFLGFHIEIWKDDEKLHDDAELRKLVRID